MKVFFIFFAICLQLTSAQKVRKPNIIFILTDDQGSADVGFTNPSTPFVTSNIDNLAANSIRLSNYYVHPTCSPTRAALMTGRYSINVGMSIAFIPGCPAGLDKAYQIMPEQLATMGYKNYLVGKWHLGGSKPMYHPLRRGFHKFYGLLGGGINYFTKQCGSGRYDLWDNFEPLYDNVTHATDMFNEEALRIIETHGKDPAADPFFLYLAHPAPHDPLITTKRHEDLCSHIENTERRLSCALVAGIDEGVGKITELLKKYDMLEDTIIAFSSDNGGVPYAGALNYPFRGAKGTAWEGGVRSPGFIHAPKIFEQSYDFQGLFHVTDFFPTFISMINSVTNETNTIDGADMLDGIDQSSSLIKQTSGQRESVHIHRDPGLDSHTFRKGPWKIIVGHHYIPFPFSKVYNETTDRWIVDGGSWRGRLTQTLLELMHLIVGKEDGLFLKYMFWTVCDSQYLGGLKNLPMASGSKDQVGLFQSMFKSDLTEWSERHTSIYPTVSLFNLDEDPQEANNLAGEHPDLVKDLLAEAEKAISSAPPQFRGQMMDTSSPKGPDADSWLTILRNMGTRHNRVIPFGPYLSDDQDLNKLEFIPGFMSGNLSIKVIMIKMFLVIVVLPLLILYKSAKFATR